MRAMCNPGVLLLILTSYDYNYYYYYYEIEIQLPAREAKIAGRRLVKHCAR
jgi:hypothetical protein